MKSVIKGTTLIRTVNFWLAVFIIDIEWLWNFKFLSIIFCSASTCKVFLSKSIDSLAIPLFVIKQWNFSGFRKLWFSLIWNYPQLKIMNCHQKSCKCKLPVYIRKVILWIVPKNSLEQILSHWKKSIYLGR